MQDISDDDVFDLYKLCQDAYKFYGTDLNFPKDTDPKKTYQWRYLKSIAHKFELWKLNQKEREDFIKIAVEQAKLSGYLHKGLSVLHQNNLLDSCYERLNKLSRGQDQNLRTILNNHRWLLRQAGSSDMKNILLKTHGSMKNIVLWYQSNSISALYIALSKLCMATYSHLSQAELKMMPTKPQLFLLRQDFMINPKARQICQEINQISVKN